MTREATLPIAGATAVSALPVRSRLYAAARDAAPLRIVLAAPLRVPAWVAAFVHAAADSGWVEVQVVLVEADDAEPRTRVHADLWLYLAIERLRRRREAGMLARVDVAERARRSGSTLCAADGGVGGLQARVAALAPDLVIACVGQDAAAALAGCAPHGCWRIGTSLTDPHTGALDLLWPLLDEALSTGIALELATPAGTRVALADGNSATRGGSFALQREECLRKLPMLLLRGLRDLRGGRIDLPAGTVFDLVLANDPRPLRAGAGVRAFVITLRNTLQWWRRIWHGEDPWFLARRESATPLDPTAPEAGPVTALVAPEGRYWADPCVVDTPHGPLLFVEEYGLQGSRGVIVCLALEGGRARRLGVALEEAGHLSYPQVFAVDGAWYMTVESGAARRVSLYRARGFPLLWERVGDLLGGCLCVDPTLHLHDDGRWYLFANVSESGPGNTCDELFLFFADSLAGPYVAHPENPVVRDVRRSRPAGRLFVRDGRLIRPAQDCAPDYGAAIVFNEVLELSPTRYRERALAQLDSSWMPGLWGCHTYSAAAAAEIIDARGHPAADVACVPVDDTPLLVADLDASLPVVTALVPVYNGERFLAQALDSALAQTLTNLEVVVVDDGSTDSSGAIADRYAAAHPGRVRVVHQPNAGLPLARNAAIQVARGRYLALLDADDVWLPGHLAACVDVLERDPMVGLVHANAEDIDADGAQISYGMEDEERWVGDAHDPFAAVLLRRQHIVCPTAVFRRSVVENVGGFDPAFNRLGCEDRDLWLRIAEVSRVAYLDELHARYRIHGANMSANSERMWRARKLLADKYAQRPRGRPLRRRALAAIDADLGHELAMGAAVRPALAAFVRALRRDPMRIDAWKGLLRRLLVGRRQGIVIRR